MPKSLTGKTTSRYGPQHKFKRWLGNRRATWSGSRWGDFEGDGVLIEHKSGEQVPKRLRDWWRKVSEIAERDGLEPLLVLDIGGEQRIAVVRAETVLVKEHEEATKTPLRSHAGRLRAAVEGAGWGLRDLPESAEREEVGG